MFYWFGKPNTTGRIVTNPEQKWVDEKKQQGYLVKKVKSLPKQNQIQKWIMDSIVPSVGGKRVEPDGYDSQGYPSWLLALGYI